MRRLREHVEPDDRYDLEGWHASQISRQRSRVAADVQDRPRWRRRCHEQVGNTRVEAATWRVQQNDVGGQSLGQHVLHPPGDHARSGGKPAGADPSRIGVELDRGDDSSAFREGNRGIPRPGERIHDARGPVGASPGDDMALQLRCDPAVDLAERCTRGDGAPLRDQASPAPFGLPPECDNRRDRVEESACVGPARSPFDDQHRLAIDHTHCSPKRWNVRIVARCLEHVLPDGYDPLIRDRAVVELKDIHRIVVSVKARHPFPAGLP
jgi:hypothetical protein